MTEFGGRDPRTSLPSVDLCRLAPRLIELGSSRVHLIQCMTPYDLSRDMDAVRAEILAQRPQAIVSDFFRRDFMIDDPQERASVLEQADAAILFIGPSSTSLHVHWRYGLALEDAGMPVSVVVPPPLEAGARYEQQMRGTPLRWTVATSPGASDQDRTAMAQSALNALVRPLSSNETKTGVWHPEPHVDVYAGAGTADEQQQQYLELGVTDGLPVIIPTDDRVATMLAGTSHAADRIVCLTLRPEGLATSVENVAINAVMAGARPQHLPVILAAVSMFGDLQLESMTRSVNGFAFTHLVHGPLARGLGIQGEVNAVGVTPTNAVIERAIRLTLLNCGHQHFGVNSTPAIGNPVGVKVVAENEEQSPWEPLHTTLGFGSDESAISLFVGGHAIIGNFNFDGLDAVAEHLKRFDNRVGALLFVSAGRANELAARGLSRADAVEEVWNGASASLGEMRAHPMFGMVKMLIERGGDGPLWPADYLTRPDEDVVPIYPEGGIKIAVVGSTLASIMQLWSATCLRSVSVDDWM